MGGKAIKPLAEKLGRPILRLSKQGIDQIQNHISFRLGIPLIQPKSFPTKTDFGDLDLLGQFSGMNPQVIQERIGSVGFVQNGPVTSFAMPVGESLFQVDLINVPANKIEFTSRYMAWGGAGNFLGKIARFYGMKLSDDALYAAYKVSGDRHYLPITRSFSEALEILGYDYEKFEKGFSSEQDFLKYVKDGKLFKEEAFLIENFRHKDRVRERKRPAFKEIVVQKNTVLEGEKEEKYLTEDEFNKLSLRYPLLKESLVLLHKKLQEEKDFSKKWNGTLVSNITGLEKKELGDFMRDFTSRFHSSSDFRNWVKRTPDSSIRLEILSEYAFKGTRDDLDIRVVGGAVRNAILGLKVKDIDYVVLGETPESMLKKGFVLVGKDFPVFLGPDGREYALARRERQTGRGHTAFDVDTRNVTLEEDLYRRDLTINAIALSRTGRVTDPFGGRADLETGILSNVSDHFSEDPLRVLRVARFYAILGSHKENVKIAPELEHMLSSIVNAGGLDSLSKERIFQELSGCLNTDKPSLALNVLHECGALARILPEVANLDGVPQSPQWHPEGDAFVHTLLVVDKAAEMHSPAPVRFAALVHDVGKGLTPKELLPKHHGHENRGVPLVEEICERLGVPSSWKKLALAVTENHLKLHKISELKPKTIHDLLETIGGLKKDTLTFFENVIAACRADDYGKNRFQEYQPGVWAKKMSTAAMSITGETLLQKAAENGGPFPEGEEFGERLRELRIGAIRQQKQELKRTMEQERS
jgi:tRNA nucleotidyltransferase (CCA-adding enzyme)